MHVKGSLNPADIGTRGVTLSQLDKSEWLNGPAWLKEDSSRWPEQPNPIPEEDCAWVINDAGYLLDWSRFSQYNRLLNVIVWCLRVKSNQRGSMLAKELEQAELIVIRQAQKEMYSDIFDVLADKKSHRVKSDLAKLCPFVDERGTLRLKGRLKNAHASELVKHPILLSSKHPAVKLLMIQAHKLNHHEGTEYVRSILQQRF